MEHYLNGLTSQNLSNEVDIPSELLYLVESRDDGDGDKLVLIHLGLQILVVRQVLTEKEKKNIRLTRRKSRINSLTSSPHLCRKTILQ
jgi:hypothetical protein